MSSKKRVVVITGVPGTGKTFVSNLLRRRLPDAEVINVTEVVNRKKLFSSHAEDGSNVVNMRKLKAELERLITKSGKPIVILESHLLCDMKLRGAKAIVLREHLGAVRERLLKRGYGEGKIEANIVSEATDYCGIHAARNYGYVFEAFAADKQLIPNILKIINGKKPKSSDIELLPELSMLLKKN